MGMVMVSGQRQWWQQRSMMTATVDHDGDGQQWWRQYGWWWWQLLTAIHGNGVDGNEWKCARNGSGKGNGKGNMSEAGKQQQHIATASLIAASSNTKQQPPMAPQRNNLPCDWLTETASRCCGSGIGNSVSVQQAAICKSKAAIVAAALQQCLPHS